MEMAKEPKPYKFLGLSLALIIALNTYIPFYFFIIVISFAVFYKCFYAKEANAIIKKWAMLRGSN